ncbi:alpha/beta hydrolase [Tichowtungia aerotolerans]|uniref:Alpha/beta fold hydrolase n=1 Tax=Tichowtungia aerotolerans TaxID=2697043 RepID=A0A6P1M7N4_9BACT|nr:alpha/beta hydrolase [Tichowtungia aerotolerans]QHI70052.1 alpha/beta fold hydrolase [Tichowtungia aerotolerans]
MKKMLLIIIFILTATALAGLDHVFYYPDHREYTTPTADGYKFEEVQFPSKDGTKLFGWFIPARDNALGTVIHFHGNAQNMSAHYSFVSWLPANGFNLFVFDYRGYGKSEGRISRRGVYEDSVAAIEYIKTRTDIDQNKIILFGQSIGGVNALSVAGNNRFDGVVGVAADSAFSSYKGVAMDHTTLLKPLAALLISNKFSPKKSVQNISPVPLLLIHGTADKVVPYRHAEVLLKKAGEPKELWTVPNGKHTEALGAYFTEFAPKLLTQFKTWAGAK